MGSLFLFLQYHLDLYSVRSYFPLMINYYLHFKHTRQIFVAVTYLQMIGSMVLYLADFCSILACSSKDAKVRYLNKNIALIDIADSYFQLSVIAALSP